MEYNKYVNKRAMSLVKNVYSNQLDDRFLQKRQTILNRKLNLNIDSSSKLTHLPNYTNKNNSK